MNYYSEEMIDSIDDLLKIGISLTSEKDYNQIFEMILTEARKVTHADAGTLYLCDQNYLYFKILHNDSLSIYQGGKGEQVNLPPLPKREENVASYVAIHKKAVNIPDVYDNDMFDFSGPKNYDAITGYRTKSMLVLPLKNPEDEVIGVLQLINSLDHNGEVCPFPFYIEHLVESLASQAGAALSNLKYIEEIDKLFNSFVEVMVTAIDSRSPYNVNHTRSVVQLSERMVDYLNRLHEKGLYPECFNENRKKQLIISAWLHDIGKISIPTRVMDKPTRLGRRMEDLRQRFDLIRALTKIQYLEEENNVSDWKEYSHHIEEAWELITYCDDPSHFVDVEKQEKLKTISSLHYINFDGHSYPYITPEELENLSIPRGTLTAEERKIMENHVVMTGKMLEKMYFNQKLQHVPQWATLHHELLDGSGYPYALKGDEIPLEVRIITIMDIYDALTATDRPYKKPMPPERAIDIIKKMVEEGKLDHDLVEHFVEGRVWESK